MKVYNMKNMKSPRTGREIPNQFIIHTDNKVVFQSYSSTIVSIDFGAKTIEVYPDWDYSSTTGKYRNMFLREYFSSLDSKNKIEKALQVGEIDGFKIVKMW